MHLKPQSWEVERGTSMNPVGELVGLKWQVSDLVKDPVSKEKR